MSLNCYLWVAVGYLSLSNGVIDQNNQIYNKAIEVNVDKSYTENIEKYGENSVYSEDWNKVYNEYKYTDNINNIKDYENTPVNELESGVAFNKVLQVYDAAFLSDAFYTHNLTAQICQLENEISYELEYPNEKGERDKNAWDQAVKDSEEKKEAAWGRVSYYETLCDQYCCTIRVGELRFTTTFSLDEFVNVIFDECGAIDEVYAPCRLHGFTAGRFPDCCPRLVCPPYYTYLDALMYTISLVKSKGKAKRIYGTSTPPPKSCQFVIPKDPKLDVDGLMIFHDSEGFFSINVKDVLKLTVLVLFILWLIRVLDITAILIWGARDHDPTTSIDRFRDHLRSGEPEQGDHANSVN